MRRWLALGVPAGALLGLALAGAASAQTPAQTNGQFDGQYVGELRLDGVVSGDCTPPPLGSTYPLTIAGGEVRFAYVPRFATTLTGHIDAKGNFQAAARVPSGTIRMTGHVDGLRIAAAILSPSCRYTYRASE